MTLRTPCATLVMFVLLACTPHIMQAQWVKTSGPNGGRITTLFCNGSYIFAGVQNAGVFRSSNKGERWIECNTGLTTRNIRNFVVSGSYLLVGTDDSGVFRSSDNGTTWSDANDGKQLRSVTGLAVAGNDIYMSATDEEAETYLFHSTDHGGDWNIIVTDKSMGLLGGEDTCLYSAAKDVYRTTNRGASWDSLYHISNGNVRSIIVSGANVFLATLGKGVVRSIDRGEHWVASNSGLPKVQTITISAMTIRGSDLFIGFNSSLYRSSDSGISWLAADTGLDSISVTALASDGVDLYAGTYDGIFRSTDNGDHWVPVSQPLTAAMISSSAVKGNNLFAATEAGTLFHSSDNGDEWIATGRFPKLNSPITALLFRGNNLYASSPVGYDGIFRSTDDGTHWALTSKNTRGSYDLAANDSFLVSAMGYVSRSSDSGETWVPISSGLGGAGDYRKLAIVGDTLYIGSLSDGVLRSTNNGTNWTRAGTELSNKGIHALAASGKFVVAGCMGAIYRSFNYGASWKLAYTDLSQFDILSLKITGNDWYAGTTGGILRSIDEGKNWEPINDGLPEGIRVTSITVSGNDLVIGTSGSSVWRRPLEQIAAGVQPKTSTYLITASLHPNPVVSSGTLLYHLDSRSTVSITIYDALGRIVSRPVVESLQETGEHQMLLEAEGFAPGVYLCAIRTGGMEQSVRFVVAQ